MGQKVNPIGLRLGINRTWDSRWFSRKEYGNQLLDDLALRKFLSGRLGQAAVSRVLIERAAKKTRITLHSARPGVIIGKKGADIDKLRSDIAKVTNSEVSLNIVEIRKPEVDARLVAQGVADQLERRIAFRRAMLTAGLKVSALIGSTMAECDPDFAGDLGAAAVGIFASDRPTAGFQADALSPAARATYDRFAAAWGSAPIDSGSQGPGYGDAEYAISGPGESASAAATEEALSGFSAAWALFADVLPAAAAHGKLDAPSIASAARAVDLPDGSLANGAGLRFSADPATLGQNERAAAVIWQWQAVRTYAFVWPATFATGSIRFVPLP